MVKVKLLVVADDEDDYLLTRHLFDDISKGNYILDWANNAAIAREQFKRNVHDLCLMDYQLGPDDGLALLREAPELGFQAPIIMLTSRDDQVLDTQALNAGADDYLVKSQLSAARLTRSIRYAVARREMENERMERRRAESESRLKSQFLAHLSHELRTPLTAILGYTDLLLSRKTDAEDIAHLQVVKRNGAHLLSLLNDVLDLSRIEAGKLEIDKRDVRLNSFVADLHSLMAVSASDKNLEFRVTGTGLLPERIHTDPTRLRQILLNLIGNAIKFTDSGKVELIISCDRSMPAPTVQFAIRDTGVGIAADELSKLFRPFAQAANSSARQEKGTGLGLAISQQLANHLGGGISVESLVNQGSTFTVTVDPGPLEEVKQMPLSITAELETAIRESTAEKIAGHFLVADDLPEIRNLVGHLVTRAGGRVEYAENGLQVLQKVMTAVENEDSFDLILMDIQMPAMDGLETTKRLRAQGLTLPIVALTAATMSGERERCLAAGCDVHLSKPINEAMLLGELNRQLNASANSIDHREDFAKAENLILLIEDNRDAREATREILKMLGWSVLEADSGAQALQVLSAGEPSVALVDINLPDSDGFQVASDLRAAGLKARLIALSGHQLHSRELAGSPFETQLVKPLALSALRGALLSPRPGAGSLQEERC